MLIIGTGIGIGFAQNARGLQSLFGPSDSGFIFGPFGDLTKLFQNSNGTTAVTADDDPVGYVADVSGKGNTAIQATAGRRAAYKTNSGKPYLNFDGADDRLVSTVNPTTALTMAAAVRFGAATGADQFAMGGGETATPLRGYLGMALTTGFPKAVWGSTTIVGSASIASADHVLLVTGNASAVTLYVDGVQVATGTPTGAPGGTTGFINLGSTNPNGGATGFMAGRIYEAMSINRVVIAEEIALISASLRAAYQ